MKPVVFTICSNNYLAQAIVLGNSVKEYNPIYHFIIFLVDEKSDVIDYNQIPHEVVLIREVEPAIDELVIKYNIIELNTAVKPEVLKYLLNKRNAEKIIYIDPDIKLYGSLQKVEDLLDDYNVILTPHILTPIPIENKLAASENIFLNFGMYNLGFIALRKSDEIMELVEWWKGHTYNNGYINVSNGTFVDQLPANFIPIFFEKVLLLRNMGYNMAPWNLHERVLSKRKNRYYVNNSDPLCFYHFSSFKVDNFDLSFRPHSHYTINMRKDLQELFQEYNDELKSANYFFFKSVPCKYVINREEYLQNQQKARWKKTPLHKKIMILLFRSLKKVVKSFVIRLNKFLYPEM